MAPDDPPTPPSTPPSDTKACPLCGETIKAIAIRCKHCQADLSGLGARPRAADFTRGADAKEARFETRLDKPAAHSPSNASAGPPANPLDEAEFERRFLDFAYETDERLTPISVAHALKLPIAFCDLRLEMLAAGDTIRREVDD